MSEPRPPNSLERALGLKEATALNMIDMVGIGPFIVMPLVMKAMNGPQCLFAWVAGALLAMIDGAVWAELGAAMPEAGGSYAFLRRIYDPGSWGKLLSFLFIWQTLIQAPLVVASGAIGFSQYAGFLLPLGSIGQKALSGGVVIILTFLLYRSIGSVGKISLLLWVGVIGTIVWIIVGGATHFNSEMAFGGGLFNGSTSWLLFAGLGQATVKTVYSYLGYYNVCHLGSEIKDPGRIIPKSIFISIIGIALLYLAMQLSVLGVIPWQDAQHSSFIFSTFVERIYGKAAADVATVMILWIAFSSLFAVMLGYSRIPYAAARDGAFFSAFAKVHPKKHFPHVSLLALAATGFCFSLLFRLGDVISAILAMRILVQFIGQAIGLIIWRSRNPAAPRPFKMWLFPLPAILAILAWLWLFWSIDWQFEVAGIAMIVLGIALYMFRARVRKEWPFAMSGSTA